MHITLKTKVDQNFLTVKEGFNEQLFLSLNPPFPPVHLMEFGGCQAGDIVHLRLNFIVFKQDWISKITFDRTTNERFEFIDEGKKLPFFLKQWKHHHIVNKVTDHTAEIVDDIHYSASFSLLSWLLYPLLWMQFAYRKPIYKRIFSAKD